ncbi:MAG TPA: heme ABC transporter ATP-binding protein [Bacillales bacterium]|nr:heme ABC transporter ATP-binding protein [Bacillales bacterium]
MLEVQEITGSYKGRKVIEDVSFSVKKGEIFGILGPNGSGKTTLMKMLTRIHALDSGKVLLHGRNLRAFGSKELAQTMAVLPQFIDESFTYTVREVVSMGRYPYQKGLFKALTADDEKAVQQAMDQTGVKQFAEQSIHSLSGGEKQRVYLAQALAQEPQLLFLDEPTNHLDIRHQKNLLDGLKQWADRDGLTVVAIFHDLNLAALYCDRLLLLENGRTAALSAPKDILAEDRIMAVYGTKVNRLLHPELPRPLMTMSPEKLGSETARMNVSDLNWDQTDDMIKVESPLALKTFSSAVIGGGFSWKRCFVNRKVDKIYSHADEELNKWLAAQGMNPEVTAAMISNAEPKSSAIREIFEEGFAVSTMVTAGICGPDEKRSYAVNVWIFIDGSLSEEAFVQSIMTATEAKMKALYEMRVEASEATSQDGLLIAAAQRGMTFSGAGSGMPIGRVIRKAVYECTVEAIDNVAGNNEMTGLLKLNPQ